MPSLLTHLECSECGALQDAHALQRLCPECARPLLARYDLERARASLTPAAARARDDGFTRYAEVLPFQQAPIDLGQARTPLLRCSRLDGYAGAAEVHVKDESLNPTGSFKARGLAAAVSRAQELGAAGVALPTAGNAGMALAAYAARAGLPCLVVCPQDTPAPFVVSARQLGARVVLHDGLIDECGARLAAVLQEDGLDYFDCSTLKEPYRLEGKKTMGYDLVLQLGRVPDVVVYPTGGGTGLVGIWKALDEMQTLGWIGSERPRMVCVQATGCAPMARAFDAGDAQAEPWANAHTYASGLRVPRAVGDRLILRALRESKGTAVTIEDADMERAAAELGRLTGILAAPEGGACWAATRRLADEGWISGGQTVALLNTGTALSYVRSKEN